MRSSTLLLGLVACAGTSEAPSGGHPDAGCTWRAACSSSNPKEVVSKNTCSGEEFHMMLCGTINAADTCRQGVCVFPTPQFLGAEFNFPNMSLGWISAKFPRRDVRPPNAALDTCTTWLTSSIPRENTGSVAVQQVSIENASGARQPIPYYSDEVLGVDTPYYLLLQPDNIDEWAMAGQTWAFNVLGSNGVPSFRVEFTVAEPINTFEPLPDGAPTVDFHRSSPPAWKWSPGAIAGQTVYLTLSGTTLDGADGRNIACALNDDGEFQVPPDLMADFYPSQLSLTFSRRFARVQEVTGLNGGVLVVSDTSFATTDSQGTALPMLYDID